MNALHLERHFARIGARANVHPDARRDRRSGVAIDIGRDERGEFFDVAVAGGEAATELLVLDVQPRLRHLLLLSDQRDGKHRFLCGHDERHWFVAGVPERAAATSVRTAFDALKPAAVRAHENRLHVRPQRRNRRRNEAFVRQGEWFFLPVPRDGSIDVSTILHDEPISRGRGKPHLCEELIRFAGELVYVAPGYERGLTERQRESAIGRNKKLRNLNWTPMRRNPTVYVRGRVRHPDHKTICLDGWHQVLMNTENESAAMRHVAFLD